MGADLGRRGGLLFFSAIVRWIQEGYLLTDLPPLTHPPRPVHRPPHSQSAHPWSPRIFSHCSVPESLNAAMLSLLLLVPLLAWAEDEASSSLSTSTAPPDQVPPALLSLFSSSAEWLGCRSCCARAAP